MPAVGKMIFSLSWSNLGVLVNSISVHDRNLFHQNFTELNFKGKVAPSPLREEGCGLFLNYIKLFLQGRGKGGKISIT